MTSLGNVGVVNHLSTNSIVGNREEKVDFINVKRLNQIDVGDSSLNLSKINFKNQSNQNRYSIGLSNDHFVIKDTINDFSVLMADKNTQQVTIPGLARTSDVYSRSYIDSSLNLKADASDIPTDFYSRSYVDSSLNLKANTSDIPTDFYNQSYIDNSLNLKANISDIPTDFYSQSYVDNSLNLKANTSDIPTDFYSQSYIDTSFNDVTQRLDTTDTSVNDITTSLTSANVKIGEDAGDVNFGSRSIAVGLRALKYGVQNQNDIIALGTYSAQSGAKYGVISIGAYSSFNASEAYSISIGVSANGQSSGAGQNSIAIGNQAKTPNQNSILLNATGNPLSTSNSNAFYVKPIRSNSTSNSLFYNSTTGEITYGSSSSSSSYSQTYIDNSFADVYTKSYIDNSFNNVAQRLDTLDTSVNNIVIPTDFYSRSYVDNSLNLKANTSDIPTDFYSRSYVDNSLNLKANTSYVDNSLNLKANTSYVDNLLKGSRVKIGDRAGEYNQGTNSCAVGKLAQYSSAGNYATALGNSAGDTGQGANSLALGAFAGKLNQHSSTIVLNATGADLNTTQSEAFFVKPVRNIKMTNSLFYNPTSGEVTYGSAAPIVQHKTRTDYGAPTGSSLIYGLNDYEFIGNSVAMSDDGTILITGGAEDERGGDGRARVYALSNTAGPGGVNPHWVQQGPTINGSLNSKFGECVDVTGDGTRFVIGAGAEFRWSEYSQTTPYQSHLQQPGYFEVYEYNSSNNTYTLVGSRVKPRNVNNSLWGQQVAISKNGNRVVVSSPTHNWGNGSYGGFILYELINNTWTELGHIKGLQSYTQFGGYRGRALAISDDGTRVVVGISRYDATPNDGSTTFHGRVEIWQYKSSTGTNPSGRGSNFDLLHSVDGTNHLDQLGHSATISGNGKVVAYGTHGWDIPNNTNIGKVDVIYEETTITSPSMTYPWLIKGDNNDPIRTHTDGVGDGGQVGESTNNNFGYANLDLSEDGNVIATYIHGVNKVLCFQYVASLDKWEDMDKFDAIGGYTDSRYGYGLALTRDGTKLAIGAPHNTTSNYRGLVQTFDITNLYVAPGTLYHTGNYQVRVMP